MVTIPLCCILDPLPSLALALARDFTCLGLADLTDPTDLFVLLDLLDLTDPTDLLDLLDLLALPGLLDPAAGGGGLPPPSPISVQTSHPEEGEKGN